MVSFDEQLDIHKRRHIYLCRGEFLLRKVERLKWTARQAELPKPRVAYAQRLGSSIPMQAKSASLDAKSFSLEDSHEEEVHETSNCSKCGRCLQSEACV